MAQRNLPTTSRSLPIVLTRARETVMSPIREMLNESGITEQQWRILRVLEELGPQDSSSLAGHACLLPSSITRITQSMVERGLLSRQSDTHDRRRQSIAITDEGRALIDKNRDRGARIGENFRQKLGDEKFSKLIELLTELADR